jgi:hypothetical protein
MSARNMPRQEYPEKDREIFSIKEKYENDLREIREEMENKFQQILAKIDVATLK